MNTDLIFQIIFDIILLSALITVSIHRGKAQIERGSVSHAAEPLPIRLPLRLFGLGMWGGVLLQMIRPRWMAWATVDLPAWTRMIGAVLALSGMPIAIGAALAIGSNVTKTVATRADHQLIVHGPYRWIRHPLYTAGMLLITGLSLLVGNWFILVMMIGGYGFLMNRVPLEEAQLVETFGDEYRDYMKKTGRFLPRLRR